MTVALEWCPVCEIAEVFDWPLCTTLVVTLLPTWVTEEMFTALFW